MEDVPVYHKKDVESNAILRMVHFWDFYSTMEVIILTNLAYIIRKIKSLPAYILNVESNAILRMAHFCDFYSTMKVIIQTNLDYIIQKIKSVPAYILNFISGCLKLPLCIFKIFFKAYLSFLQIPLHVCRIFYAIALHVYRKYVQTSIEKIKTFQAFMFNIVVTCLQKGSCQIYYMYDKAPKVYSTYVQPLIVNKYMALKKYASRLESHLGITEDKGTTTEATEAIVARDAAVSATPPILTTATGTTTAHGGRACSEAASNVLDSTNHYGDKVKKRFEHIERKGNKSYGVWLPGRYHREETMSTEGGLLKQFLSFCNNKHQSSQVIVRDDTSLRPLVLPCVNASRVGSDIEASFNASGVPELKHASGSLQPLLLLFHPRRPFRSDVSPPTRIKGGDSIERCEDIIDIVFDNNQVYECKQNVMAAKEFIKKIKELKKK